MAKPISDAIDRKYFTYKIKSFLRTFLHSAPVLKIKIPQPSQKRLDSVLKKYPRLHAIKKFPHYINTIRIFYLLTLYKTPVILAEHFAFELARVRKRKQWPVIHSFNVILKTNMLYTKILKNIRVGIYGKINASTRTRVHYMLANRKEPVQRFDIPVQYAQSSSLAKTGVFGVKV